MPTSKRNLVNILANVIGWGWPIGLSILTTPYIVHSLGEESYGVVAIVSVIVGYFSILDLGLNVAGIKFISEYNAKSQNDKIQAVLGSTLAVFSILGIVGAIAIWLSAEPLASQVFQIPKQLVPAAVVGFRLAAGGLFLTMIIGALSSVPPALQRYDLSSAIAIGTGTLTVIGTVAVVFGGQGIPEVILVSVIASIISLIAYGIIIYRLLPGINLLPKIDTSILRILFGFGGFALLNKLLSLLMLQFDRTILGIWLGPVAVTLYVVPLGLSKRIQELIGQLSAILLPMSSELHGQGEWERLQNLYLRGTNLTLIVSTGMTVTLLSYKGQILSKWMGEEFARQSDFLFGFLILSFYILSMSAVASYIIHGLGRPQIDTRFSLLTTVINIVACFLLIPRFGVNGAAEARVISVAIPLLPYLWYVEGQILQLPPLKGWIRMYIKPFVAGLIVYLVSVVWLEKFVHNIATLVAFLGLTSGIYFTIVFIIGGFSDQDKQLMYRWIEGIPGFNKLVNNPLTSWGKVKIKQRRLY